MLRRLLTAIGREGVKVGVQLAPALVYATWKDAETGKPRYASVRIDEALLDSPPAAQDIFIGDFAHSINEIMGATRG